METARGHNVEEASVSQSLYLSLCPKIIKINNYKRCVYISFYDSFGPNACFAKLISFIFNSSFSWAWMENKVTAGDVLAPLTE